MGGACSISSTVSTRVRQCMCTVLQWASLKFLPPLLAAYMQVQAANGASLLRISQYGFPKYTRTSPTSNHITEP